MFNFMKLKGLDNILYSTTGVDCCTSENWNFLLCYAAGLEIPTDLEIPGSQDPRDPRIPGIPTAESDVPIMGFHGIPGID